MSRQTHVRGGGAAASEKFGCEKRREGTLARRAAPVHAPDLRGKAVRREDGNIQGQETLNTVWGDPLACDLKDSREVPGLPKRWALAEVPYCPYFSFPRGRRTLQMFFFL